LAAVVSITGVSLILTLPILTIPIFKKRVRSTSPVYYFIFFEHWPDNPRLDTIVILEGWERDTSMPKPKPTITSNLDYWTKY
ncbi:hypothetical protein M3201_24400, partial [Paenibacillus motobuensis]|uniref:hypothetical protein n=1 Tax=Paenibacillus TaxID=44249 RepID=UPI002041FBEC